MGNNQLNFNPRVWSKIRLIIRLTISIHEMQKELYQEMSTIQDNSQEHNTKPTKGERCLVETYTPKKQQPVNKIFWTQDKNILTMTFAYFQACSDINRNDKIGNVQQLHILIQ